MSKTLQLFAAGSVPSETAPTSLRLTRFLRRTGCRPGSSPGRAFAGKRHARLCRTYLAASAGYTLIEILVVLTIISLLLGLVGPRVLDYLGELRVKTTRLQIESFGSALDLFYLDTGRYPTGSEGLDALARRPSNVAIWNGPYLKGGRVPADPWGHPYQYRSPVERTPPYEIMSFGADGREGGSGTAADISNVEQ